MVADRDVLARQAYDLLAAAVGSVPDFADFLVDVLLQVADTAGGIDSLTRQVPEDSPAPGRLHQFLTTVEVARRSAEDFDQAHPDS